MSLLTWLKVGIVPMMGVSTATLGATHSLSKLGILTYNPLIVWVGVGWSVSLVLVAVVFSVLGVRNFLRESTRPPARRDPDSESDAD